MSLAMHRSQTSSMASSSLQRSPGSAMKATIPTYDGRSRGTTTSISSSPSYSTSRQAHSLAHRPLPTGPGPLLPSRSTAKSDFNYVTRNLHRTSLQDRQGHKTLSTMESPKTQRKLSNDSGYGSSSNINFGAHRSGSYCTYGSLSGRKSKSVPQLDFFKDEDVFHRPLGDPSSHRVSHGPPSNTHNRNSDYSSGSYRLPGRNDSYRSTTHSNYTNRSYPEERRQATKAADKELSNVNGYSVPSKTNNSVIDVDKTRKETITALPTDLKMTRKASHSSSNCSSSSNSPTGRRSTDGLVGLRNLGNTCFMNSILQCLSHTWPLTDHLLKGSYIQNINSKSSMKGKLIQAFAELMKSLWKPVNTDTAVSPHMFKTQIQRFAPRFVGYNQQDSQEFLRFLLEGLHDDLNQVKEKQKYTPSEYDDSLSDNQKAEKSWASYLSRDKSLMTDLFVGQLKSMLKCCSCGYTSVTFDPFWDLSLPIPRKSGFGSGSSSPWAGRRSVGSDDVDVNIRDCMQSFTKEEVLDGDERPICDKCKVRRKSTKKFSIHRFPSILVLHLKRFSGFSFRSKLQTNVDFPLTKLELGEFAAESKDSLTAVYSLYAVSNHSGSTYGGHYTAYCKHPISNEWHVFNDSRVDPLSSSRVRGSQAYILFYEKIERKSSL